ncbi:MAG: HEAT repeat domain-containing protein [Candidatus Sumerlaeota bacterium]|nr:HEAT repeat domain-containing protein [Candidatus Sumerlaeota bacterium]
MISLRMIAAIAVTLLIGEWALAVDDNPSSAALTQSAQTPSAQKKRALTPSEPAPWQRAQALEQEGKDKEAFALYLEIPGCEFKAARLARPKAAEYLKIVEKIQSEAKPWNPRAEVVRGDLLLALGRKDEALASYRAVAASAAAITSSASTASTVSTASTPTSAPTATAWDKGLMPWDYYPCEPPQDKQPEGYGFGWDRWSEPLLPMMAGPGSHRDNWLIRRFIALEATADAEKEFARIWKIHQADASPFVIVQGAPWPAPGFEGLPPGIDFIAPSTPSTSFTVSTPSTHPIPQKTVVYPSGFDGMGLQFALDYAYFLKRGGRSDEALKILSEVLARIDLDRNPNNMRFADSRPYRKGFDDDYPVRMLRRTRYFGMALAGVSRKEFIRLAFGAFKDAGKEKELIENYRKSLSSFEKLSPGGRRPETRVLARLYLHQGNDEEALRCEQAYINGAFFKPLTAAYRLGCVYEEFKKNAEAAAEFEKALALPPETLDLPDEDEEATQRAMMSQMAMPMRWGRFGGMGGQPSEGLRREIMERLNRLYTALGQNDKAMRLALKQYESDANFLGNFEMMSQTAQRFRTEGKEEEFRLWAKNLLVASDRSDASDASDQSETTLTRTLAKNPSARATLAWFAGDLPAAAKALARGITGQKNGTYYYYDWEQWKERFRQKGKDQLRMLLAAIVEANPKDARTRLELLDLEDRFEGPAVIESLEILLNANPDETSAAFARGKGVYNRTQFRNYYDLAYRLMRLYEKADQLDKLRALGLRLAKGEKPFEAWWNKDENETRYRDANDWPEDLNGALALLIQFADDKTQTQLNEIWKSLGDFPAKRQLARRREVAPTADSLEGMDTIMAQRWNSIPKGVWLYASLEDILSMQPADDYFLVGTPCGISLYDIKGRLYTRIPLGGEIHALAYGRDLWAALPLGVCRIGISSVFSSRANPPINLTWLDLDQDLPPQEMKNRKRDYGPTGALTLALDGDFLWIGTRRNIQRLDITSNVMRVFSSEELGIEHSCDCGRFLVEKDYVWASIYNGLLRYDRKSDRWTRVLCNEKPVSLIGVVDGALWGDVYLNDKLRNRPCLIDRDTLETTAVLIQEVTNRGEEIMMGEPMPYQGKWNGKPVFGPFYQPYYYDASAGVLKPLPKNKNEECVPFDSDMPAALKNGIELISSDYATSNTPAQKSIFKCPSRAVAAASNWQMSELGNGKWALGTHTSRWNESPFDPHCWETRDNEGGLYFVPAGSSKGNRISSGMGRTEFQGLPGGTAYCASHDPETMQTWVCTNRGVAVLGKNGAVFARYTRGDGLCANRVTSAVKLGGLIYFSTGWGDHGGGLGVYDPKTHVFTSLVLSDGLATNKIASIEVEGERLRIVYDVEYGRGGGYHYRQFPAGYYDPKMRTFTAAGKPMIFDDTEMNKRAKERKEKYGDSKPLPLLGGIILSESKFEGRTYLCGTRGMVVTSDQSTTALAAAANKTYMTVKVETSPDEKQKEEARQERSKMRINSPEDLQRYLESPNPYLRAEALSTLLGQFDKDKEKAAEFTPLLAQGAADAFPRARATAIFLLSHSSDVAAAAPLERAMNDHDPKIRAAALLGLARKGQRPDATAVEDILKRRESYSNYPFGAFSTIGVIASEEHIYRAVAQHADPELFKVFLKYPLARYRLLEDGSNRDVLPALAAALRKSPESAQVLLSAHNADKHNRVSTEFAQIVFGATGKEMLPLLHEALASKDRIVRSNAARACGAIGDSSSIPPLIQALDLESGLARASIVWALGELKAAPSLARMAELYIDARNDEKRRAGSGFRIAQSQAAMTAQYDHLRSMDAIGADWNELKSAGVSKPLNPIADEELLEPRHILEAVRKIGPGASQEFYRLIAGEKDEEGRREAAERLAEGAPADREKNIPILKGMLTDSSQEIRIRAAVSLLILGDEEAGRPVLLEYLNSDEKYLNFGVITQLTRIKDPASLKPFRARLEAIAAQLPAVYSNEHILKTIRDLLKRMESSPAENKSAAKKKGD